MARSNIEPKKADSVKMVPHKEGDRKVESNDSKKGDGQKTDISKSCIKTKVT